MNQETTQKQPGFFWLFEWSDNAVKFTDQQLAAFTRAIVSAAKGDHYELPDDPLVELAFKYANRDRERMDYQRDRNSENGRKGGAPIGNKNASKQPKNNRKTTEKQPKSSENKPKDKDKDKYKDKENIIIPTPSNACACEDEKVTIGTFGNVRLTPSELERFRMRMAEEGRDQAFADRVIDRLSCWLANGKTADNHLAALLGWAKTAVLEDEWRTGTRPKAAMTSTAVDDYEDTMRTAWKAITEADRQEYLNTHDGLLPWEYYKQHGHD